MDNKITDRYFIAVEVQLKTPLSVSNGESLESDSDLLRSSNGELFIPGTSVAGALRDYMELKKDADCVMGFSHDGDGKMSSVYVYDVFFQKDKDGAAPKTSIRDQVKLTHEKIAEAQGKFDMEIIETGAKATLFMECVKRENDSWKKDETPVDWIADFLGALDRGDVRLGSKKNRGFGWFEVKKACYRKFNKDSRKEYLDYIGTWKAEITSDQKAQEIIPLKSDRRSKYITMYLPLKQKGGISIRVYSAAAEGPDYRHITCGGKPVIPGSSWNGAIRARAYEILKELELQKEKNSEEAESHVRKLIDGWFGHVLKKTRRNQKNTEISRQSQLIYKESVLKDFVSLPMTRNKIDRFSAAAVSTALYTEQSCFDGDTELIVKIRKREHTDDMALAGLMYLIFDEIQGGFVSVGGQTAVGRGIFEWNNKYDAKDAEAYGSGLDRKECLSALYAVL